MKRKREYNIEKLEQQYKFQRNIVNNKIKLIPLSQHSFQTYPLNKLNIIEVTDEEFIGLLLFKKQFNIELNQVIDFTIKKKEVN